jgi:hypothetical protein
LIFYLDPVELNGDEYQNIEIAGDKSANNNEANGQNQNRPDSLTFINDVS